MTRLRRQPFHPQTLMSDRLRQIPEPALYKIGRKWTWYGREGERLTGLKDNFRK